MRIISDLRKCKEIHQRNKYNIAKKTSSFFLRPHLRSDVKRINRPARSWIRDQLTGFYDDNLEESVNDEYEKYVEDSLEESEMEAYIDAQWSEIYEAVDLDNADLLDRILPLINIFNGKEKYWSSSLYTSYNVEHFDILSHAINLGHTKCVRVLLDKVYSNDIDPRILDGCNLWRNKTPFRCACVKGDLNLVRELVERAHVKIDQRGVLETVVKEGHEALVEYLLSHGYDLQNLCAKYILCIASSRGHLGIVKILLKYGADPSRWDYYSLTPLDYAINEGRIDIVEALLVHTHGNIGANNDNLTPMMLAAHYNLRPIVNLLFKMLPLDQAADDLLQLACRYTVDPVMQNPDMAFYFFAQGLNGKQTMDSPIHEEVYEFRQECQTFDQLELIKDDENAIRMHALLVNERIFLQHQDRSTYIALVKKQCVYYRDHQLFHRSLQLYLHATQLILRIINNVNDPQHSEEDIFLPFVTDLRALLRKGDVVPIDTLAIIFNLNLDFKESYSIFDLLLIVIYMIQSKRTTKTEQRLLLSLVKRAVKTESSQRSILGYFITQHQSHISSLEDDQNSISTLFIVSLLIKCGSDVNQRCDRSGNRPLHIIARCSGTTLTRSIIELLLSSGACPDIPNASGRSPQELTWQSDARELLYERQKLSLKCRCAKAIVSLKISYENCLNSNLVAFVQSHTNPQEDY